MKQFKTLEEVWDALEYLYTVRDVATSVTFQRAIHRAITRLRALEDMMLLPPEKMARA